MTDENAPGWASVGRRLAHARLEAHAEATSYALHQAAHGAREGDLSAAEVRRCYEALEDAEMLLDEIAEAVEGFDRPPRLVERLDQEQLLELVETPES